ncbi:transposase [Streptomyces sp. NPDC003758]|uniref:Transposase n=1 Tax=Streptomyces cynarae TaxID=2981134 RepID=A0ABY6EDJ5_9ACTN|nr:transposase [Streptomyces cynarae]UXY24242.1 transposase [Streptomyces cynarae]
MTYRTVQRLADAAAPEDLFHGQWQGRRTKLDDFKPYLRERWAEGCTNAWTLWEEIKTHGYRGGYGAVRAYLRPFRTTPTAPATRPPSPRTVPRWILTHPDTLPESERLKMKSVLAHCPELAALTAHVRAFGKMLTQLEGDRLPQWIKAVRADDLPSLHAFANGLERDLAAVTAGLTLPWSSGVVEGHVNRIKMLKRQMYGPALRSSGSEPSSYPDPDPVGSYSASPKSSGNASRKARRPGLVSATAIASIICWNSARWESDMRPTTAATPSSAFTASS